MAKATDLASFLVALRNFDEKKNEFYSLSNLKIQKILYYCQGRHYQRFNEPIIEDAGFEAWSYGPVVPEIYRRFMVYGRNDISENEGENYILNENEMETVKEIWNQLKTFDAYTLVNATHAEPPWADAFSNGRTKIENEEIRRFFRGE